MLRLRDNLVSGGADVLLAQNVDDLLESEIHVFFDVSDLELLRHSIGLDVVRILIELESPAIRDNLPWLGRGLWDTVFGHRPTQGLKEKFSFFVLPTELGDDSMGVRVSPDLSEHLRRELVLIANNKTARNSDTYSLRRKLVRFLIQEGLETDLFGSGWDMRYVDNWLISKILNALGITTHEFSSIYRGTLSSKRSIYNRYRFNLCLENSYPVHKWYFSEKLAESFFVDALPVYLGCREVGERLGFKGVIYASDFDSVEDCVRFATTLDSASYDKRFLAYRDSQRLVRCSVASSPVAASAISDYILTLT